MNERRREVLEGEEKREKKRKKGGEGEGKRRGGGKRNFVEINNRKAFTKNLQSNSSS